MAPATKTERHSLIRRASSQGLNVTSRQLAVIVGQGDQTRPFYIHEDLVSRHSGFFAAAVKKGWKEAEERIVRLPDDMPEHFEIFIRFAYSGKIYSCMEGDVTKDNYDHEWMRLASCWVLGEKLDCITFKDALVDATRDKLTVEARWPVTLHQIIYPASCSAAQMRRLLVDIAVWKWSAESIRNSAMDEQWNAFFKDLAVRLREMSEKERAGTDPFSETGCRYHEHVTDRSPCYKTMF